MKESVLLSQIESIRPKCEPGQAIGVHSQSRWQGRDRIVIAQETWRVAQCDSVLEIRQRLTEDLSVPLVVITALSTAAIGDDVRARLFKQQLMPVDPWNSLAERFKARQVDPVLRQSTALADAALEALGNNEAPVAPSGILTPEAVWQVVLQHRLGLRPARPDLLDFLPWMTSEGSASKWESLGTVVQTQLGAWLSQSLGELGPILIRSLADGNGPDAIAVGLALGALSGASSDSRAMGRLERYTGNQPLGGTVAQRWSDAAERWAKREPMDQVRRELGRADQILQSVGALESAIFSRWSPTGFQQRLSKFAEEVVGGATKECHQAYTLVAAHEGSQYLEELRGRRERAEMAMRLVRWFEQPHLLPETLTESISRYEQDGSWVDWARHQLLGGDEPEGVTRSYRKLFDIVTARREEENRRFGELLAASTSSNSVPSGGILLIEDVLQKIVAPLAKLCPGGVLFIVMDGMSLPVWRELSLDLSKHGWVERVPESGPSYRCALTVLPSATAFSRSSLLCGALVRGAQSVEKSRFLEYAEFRPGKAWLFHKDEVGSSGADLSESLRLAVSQNDPKIVGVILNVIDDSLGGPEQLSIQWNLRSIAVLQTLLSEAKSAGRVVILASDHGHVLDHGSKLVRRLDSADRWRPANDEMNISVDELLVKGSRVLAEGSQIIAPTSETVRYTANQRLGYHGGLTTQECVAPLAVVAPTLTEIEGWEVRAATPPDWWFEGETASVKELPKLKRIGTRPPLKPSFPLFDAPGKGDWVSALLTSDVFTAQMKTFAGRLKKEQVEQYLRVLADRNLVLLKNAFAQKLCVSALRVDGLIASLQRILNVEGYSVLSVDASQTIRLNLQLLREQFELGEDDGR